MIPQFHSKRMENIWPNKNLYINVHSNLILVGTTCPSTDKWIKKMWNIIQLLKEMNYWYTLQHGWTLQTLTERNQTWKTIYFMTASIWNFIVDQNYSTRKQMSSSVGPWVEQSIAGKGNFGGVWTIPVSCCGGDSHQRVRLSKVTESNT